MPKRKQRTTHWVPDNAPMAVSPFVLADMHREGQIVAASGVPTEWAVGTRVFSHLSVPRHMAAWLTERLREGALDPMLIPIGEQVWTVDPCLYLSTGLLFWTHCPASASVIAALAESGMLDRVVLHPDLPCAEVLPADEKTHAAVHTMLSRWDAVRACMPRVSPHTDTQETVAELLRLIRTTAEFCGCEVTSVSVAESLALCAYEAEYDLPMLRVTEETVAEIRKLLPELPDARANRLQREFSLTAGDAAVLVDDPALADYFEQAAGRTVYPKLLANLILTDLLHFCEKAPFATSVPASRMAELSDLLGEGRINSSTAKKLLSRLIREDFNPAQTVASENLEQIRDPDQIRALVLEVLENNPKAVADYRRGRSAALRALQGNAMSRTAGRVDPVLLERRLLEMLNAEPV